MWVWVFLFVFLYFNYFIMIFFNVGLFVCVLIWFVGGDLIVVDGLVVVICKLF